MRHGLRYKTLSALVILIIIVNLPLILCSCKNAEFEVSNLVIEPAEALTGETVTVTVDVANTGGAEGTYYVLLLVNGINEASQGITLAPETVETVRFSLVKDSPGTYTIEIAELKGTLMVISINEILQKTAQAMAAINSYHFDCDIEVEISIPDDAFSFFEEME